MIEQFVEIHFETQSIDQAKIFDIVAEIKKSGFNKIEINQIESISFDLNQKIISKIPIPRIMCWNDDKSNLIQFSPDFIAINKVGRYFGWSDFLQVFILAHKAALKAVPNCKIRSLALNTIDEFTVPIQNFRPGNVLMCDGSKIPKWYSDCKESFDISFGKGLLNQDNFNRQIQIRCQKIPENWKITINSVFHNYLEKDTVELLLERLHNESNGSFESMITDFTRNYLMGGFAC